MPARIAVQLTDVRSCLERAGSRLAPYSELPDPTLKGWRATQATGRHDEYLRSSALVAEVKQAIALGSDREIDDRAALAQRCIELILDKRFLLVVCPLCSRDYGPEECEMSGWDSVSGPAPALAVVAWFVRRPHVDGPTDLGRVNEVVWLVLGKGTLNGLARESPHYEAL